MIPFGDQLRELGRVNATARITRDGHGRYIGEVFIHRDNLDGWPNIDAFEHRLDETGWDEVKLYHWQKTAGLRLIKNNLRTIFESYHVNHNPESDWLIKPPLKPRPKQSPRGRNAPRVRF